MSTLREHINKISLHDLALPSNIKYGMAIQKRNGVTLLKEEDTEVEAWAGGLPGGVIEGGGSRRKVQIWLKGAELRWHCAGNPKDHDVFCKHCVAVALYLREKVH